MPNSIAFAKNYVSVIDEAYQRAGVSGVLNSGRRMVRASHNAKEIMILKISVTGLGDYTRNMGYMTEPITYEFETKTFNYDRGIRLFADVMDVEEAGVNDCFVKAGAKLISTQVAPEADAFIFAQIASHTGVTVENEDMTEATASDVLAALCEVTSTMDERQVPVRSCYLFITPTLKGILDDYPYANPTMSNRVLERFARMVEVPQVRFYTAIDLNVGDGDQFGRQGRNRQAHQLHGDREVGGHQVQQARGEPRVRPRRVGIARQPHDEVPQVRHRGAFGQQARRRVRERRGIGGSIVAASVTYGFYQQTYGGGLSESAFAANLPLAEAHVRWLCAVRGVDEEAAELRRAMCAAAEAFTEYGAGKVGGYSIGEFSVKNYASQQTSGEGLATQAVLRELGLSGMAFSGVR